MIVLGADVGGTSCRVALFDAGAERGRSDGSGGTMRPGQGEATFIVALLVSTSMMSWSVCTGSPTGTSRLTTVASAMDSPSWGMIMGMEGMGVRMSGS